MSLALLAACGSAATAPVKAEPTAVPSEAAISVLGGDPAVAADQFVVRSSLVDADGTTHVRVERFHDGLRVIGGDAVVHLAIDGSLKGVSRTTDKLSPTLEAGVRSRIDSGAAIDAAEHEFAGVREESSIEQVIYARHGVHARAYEVIVEGQLADESPSELHVIIDAASGRTLDKWEGLETAAVGGTGNGFFVGNVSLTTNSLSSGFELRDPSRGGQYTVDMKNKQGGSGAIFTDADNAWGTGALSNRQTVGVDAQYGTAMTFDYYNLVHGRNGIRNDGRGAYNRVHFGRNYLNAYWSDSCFCMTYGDGDGRTYNPFDSLDVAGHEMSHGVTAATANLTYSGESGGLNEANSDIFGTMVEYYANNANDVGDYLIGERLYVSNNNLNGSETKALRSMINPSLDGRSANCWTSTVGSLDVHYSSGVGNHFYYLLAEGSTPANGKVSPTCNNSSVTGIGRSDAEKIWYRALTVYMTSSTNYHGARTASLSAAADLFGAASAQVAAVDAAWAAVSVVP